MGLGQLIKAHHMGRLAAAAMGGEAYWKRILNTESSSLIALWRQNETSGAVAADSSPEGNNGAYTGVDLGNSIGPDGAPVGLWDGANDYNNINSVGLTADLSAAAGTVLVWCKVNAAAVWTDTTLRYFISLQANSSNRIYAAKSNVDNQLFVRYERGGTNNDMTVDFSATGWWCFALTWDTELAVYVNGAAQGEAIALGGAFVGSLGSENALIGARDTVPSAVWHGWIGPAAGWSKALTPAQIASVSSV